MNEQDERFNAVIRGVNALKAVNDYEACIKVVTLMMDDYLTEFKNGNIDQIDMLAYIILGHLSLAFAYPDHYSAIPDTIEEMFGA